jgi:septum formation protein
MALAPPAAFRAVLARHSLILGSQSASRKAILTGLGVPFTVCVAGIDEQAIRRDTPEELVLALARAKADAILARLRAPSSAALPADAAQRTPLLVTADQVVVFDGVIREKPRDTSEAVSFIRGYSGSSARTVGGICVTNVVTGAAAASLDCAQVFFRHIPEDVITALVEDGSCLHCAGGLQVEHPLVEPFVDRLEGPMDSVQGLGVDVLAQLLTQVAEGRASALGQ